MQKKIDPELLKAIIDSPFSKIDYDYLLANHPAKIREEEMKIMTVEEPLPVPLSLSVENIYIPSSERQRDIRLRVYRPKGKQNLPILLYFHGGAFIYGMPEQYDFIFYRLAVDIDAVIVSADYRLAPEHPFPAAMEDGYDALLWLSESADRIGGNKNRIIIGGSSAGATIAASVTQYARDKEKVNIQHQYLLYPPTNHLLKTSSMNELANAPMQTKKAAYWMWKHYLQHQMIEPPQYSVPLQEKNFDNLPDATIIVCELDPLKDEGKEYAQKLQHAGASVHLLEIKGAVHAFDFFPCKISEDFYLQQVKLFKLILIQKL
ncbi:alpha/beta hydrolase [Chryseobacterium sp. BIGb0232]|uniref:alpha/beta hydrolase n=1 Tax=Chryseobacterium sp. BIGb0232 TaxID=2940598 RepID=UPI000F499002|nr:alpha/beta hydrolase [Chryseobacterium sp. BIGb0232]MCS4302799.1 acetyl esterase [Chryseobacterium sp. BIGb0232]ROS17451.1 acetyl esterase [Chryseobacterium nakagawai]